MPDKRALTGTCWWGHGHRNPTAARVVERICSIAGRRWSAYPLSTNGPALEEFVPARVLVVPPATGEPLHGAPTRASTGLGDSYGVAHAVRPVHAALVWCAHSEHAPRSLRFAGGGG